MGNLVNCKMIDLYKDCHSQVERDQVRYKYFNPVTTFKSFYCVLFFTTIPNFDANSEATDITKIGKN